MSDDAVLTRHDNDDRHAYLSIDTSIMSSLQKSTAMTVMEMSVMTPPDDVLVVKSRGIFWKMSRDEKEKDEAIADAIPRMRALLQRITRRDIGMRGRGDVC